jgi:hypothetical protein
MVENIRETICDVLEEAKMYLPLETGRPGRTTNPPQPQTPSPGPSQQIGGLSNSGTTDLHHI